MILVFDSAPLIYFGKTKLLEKIAKINFKLVVPKSVYREVIEIGIERGFEESIYVKEIVDRSFEIKSAKNQSTKFGGLETADMETLEIAKEIKGTAVTDDQKMRNMASIEKIDNVGSVFIIFLLLKEKIIKKQDAIEAINKMIESGWYCSTDFYSVILSKLNEM